MDKAAYESELNRIKHGPQAGESIPGIGTVRFVVTCDGNSEQVLQNAKAVMEVISRQCADDWREDANWRSMLPTDFVEACAEEMTEQEAEVWLKRWQSLGEPEREIEERERRWSLQNWLYWLSPDKRAWQWWDAQVINDSGIAIAIAVESWPFPWSALAWLFRGNGAIAFEAESPVAEL